MSGIKLRERPTFKVGQLVMTSGVSGLMETDEEFEAHVKESLRRYFSRDWGECGAEDTRTNELAVEQGDRLLAVYGAEGSGPKRIWIITEWDRSVTTVLFPDEY